MTAREALARIVIATQPYAAQVVFIGGWVHALYLAEAGAVEKAIRTDDIDITLPPRLLAEGRPMLIELATASGFEVDPLSDWDEAPHRLTAPGPGDSIIDLDLITEAQDPGATVGIEGQDGLRAQGYPWQSIALENTRWITVGPDIHESLEPPMKIRVPTISAYVLLKGLSSITRSGDKKVKDLVYLHEVLRHPGLGASALSGLPDLAERYPRAYDEWRLQLFEVSRDPRMIRGMAEQLLLSGRAQGSPDEMIAAIAARLNRTLAEAPL